jgi:hypothetical protein
MIGAEIHWSWGNAVVPVGELHRGPYRFLRELALIVAYLRIETGIDVRVGSGDAKLAFFMRRGHVLSPAEFEKVALVSRSNRLP